MLNTSSLDRIQQLKNEIANVEQAAVQELMDRHNTFTHELATIDAEIAKLTGKPVQEKNTRSTQPKAPG